MESEDSHTGLTGEALKRSFLENLIYIRGKHPRSATQHDYYMAMAHTVRDRILQRWVASAQGLLSNPSVVIYLSAEYLPGPQLVNNLLNLGILDEVREVVQDLCLDFQQLVDQEQEPGLGNGGLGRLAACYLDSMATLGIPAVGHGIRYEFGMFEQQIRDGWQVEVADPWLQKGNPWELPRPGICYEVKFGGRTEQFLDDSGRQRTRWIPDQLVKGVAYDQPLMGYRGNSVALLRLWKSEAVAAFDFEIFSAGDYYRAVEAKVISENISKVLYPNDEPEQGKKLRLQQQYFLVSCAIQNSLRLVQELIGGVGRIPTEMARRFPVQLNDTHPSLAIPELMRLLVDEHAMEWEAAWKVTQGVFSYTNHTLLPEALEKWPVDLLGRLLPRHLEIIQEINQRFLDQVRLRYPRDDGKLERLSLIDETGPRYVRMANLSCVGSHHVNGVAELHTELMKRGTFRDFFELEPQNFSNKTNGVTPRRFIAVDNPGLASLIDEQLGTGWLIDMERLRGLEAVAEDPGFHDQWSRIKMANKQRLARVIEDRVKIAVDPESLFDIQAKRIHEYKRQHLNVLHIMALYWRLKTDPTFDPVPRTFIFAGKAAPGYFMAKLIIKLIHSVGDVVNRDPAVRERLKVVFLPNFNVKNAQSIFPAADLSEQISTAGKEASGTGNMKFAMNGALTIGTFDGANIEIREAVGEENFFLFGLTAEEVAALKASGYQPRNYCAANDLMREVFDLLASGFFSGGDRELFRPLINSLLDHDEFMVLADFDAYAECQQLVEREFTDRENWTRKSILNVARIGRFSSDRAVEEYRQDIWHMDSPTIPTSKSGDFLEGLEDEVRKGPVDTSF
jgi:starch phosphorylase